MRVLIAVILAVLAIHIILLGLFTNSWATKEKEYEVKIETRIGLREKEIVTGDIRKEFFDLSELVKYEDDDYIKGYNIAGQRAYNILWIALGVCIGAIVLTILGQLGKLNGITGIVMGFIGGGLILLAAVLWLRMIPDLESYMHLGWTFYAVIVGGIIQVVSSFLMIKTRKEKSIELNMKAVIAVVLTLLVIHFISFGLFSNSWATGEIEDGGTIGVGIGLMEKEYEYPETSMTSSHNYSNTAGLLAYIILWLSLVVCIGAIIFTMSGKLRRTYGKTGKILGFTGGGLILIAVLLWLIMTPDLNQSYSIGCTYYMVIVSGFIQIGSGILVFKIKEEDSKRVSEIRILKISKRTKRIFVAIIIVLSIMLAGILIWRDDRKYSNVFFYVIIRAEDGANYSMWFPLPVGGKKVEVKEYTNGTKITNFRNGTRILEQADGRIIKRYSTIRVTACRSYYYFSNDSERMEEIFSPLTNESFLTSGEYLNNKTEIGIYEDIIIVNSNRSLILDINLDHFNDNKFYRFNNYVEVGCFSKKKIEFSLLYGAKFKEKNSRDYYEYQAIVNQEFPDKPLFNINDDGLEIEFFHRNPWITLNNDDIDAHMLRTGTLMTLYIGE